ncbi:hypothetical protein [Mangrovicoccus ximenensis]|uniref:hypothetical protein n=1 Tax=Mangrovicoccus ximenensis TaxID=1911570 RepID=UPI000D3440C6|nr:hypothetical protein [Mangrovicoccus ximenensis]
MAETTRPDSSAEADQDVAVLDQALWSQLESSEDFAEFGAAWLALLCQRIGGVSRSVLLLKSDLHGQLEPVAYWPKGRAATKGLSAAAETALRENRGVARTPRAGGAGEGRPAAAGAVRRPVGRVRKPRCRRRGRPPRP